jgi:hypothetical protein
MASWISGARNAHRANLFRWEPPGAAGVANLQAWRVWLGAAFAQDGMGGAEVSDELTVREQRRPSRGADRIGKSNCDHPWPRA